jgi:hypothetical protein
MLKQICNAPKWSSNASGLLTYTAYANYIHHPLIRLHRLVPREAGHTMVLFNKCAGVVAMSSARSWRFRPTPVPGDGSYRTCRAAGYVHAMSQFIGDLSTMMCTNCISAASSQLKASRVRLCLSRGGVPPAPRAPSVPLTPPTRPLHLHRLGVEPTLGVESSRTNETCLLEVEPMPRLYLLETSRQCCSVRLPTDLHASTIQLGSHSARMRSGRREFSSCTPRSPPVS